MPLCEHTVLEGVRLVTPSLDALSGATPKSLRASGRPNNGFAQRKDTTRAELEALTNTKRELLVKMGLGPSLDLGAESKWAWALHSLR